ncbi:DNA-binding protein VF530 [Thalassotalea litorea]|uniref:DNA-binding protein VF530 n=1 Tax=Thalassotalea litorea TaxID=2020715 RepID=A0A5R9IP82_9GAMM|nr:DNA-binding protein VF530 [Thalassotalea litorea]
MYTPEEYENNPLHGTSLEQVLTQLVDHYGWDILAAYINLNCFKQNPSIKASLKFLKKTDWAQQKVESFYLYQFKNLPRASDAMFELPPRDRIVPMEQKPKDPQELSVEDGMRLQEKRAQSARDRDNRSASDSRGNRNQRDTSYSSKSQDKPYRQQATKETPRKPVESKEAGKFDPYADFKNK